MKRTRRTLLSLALCAAICLSLLPGTARAEDTGYSFDSGTLTITTDEGTTAWKRAGINSADVTTVVVEDGVNVIQENAFNNCWNLSSVTLPDGLTSIGLGAFYQCTSLRSLDFPAALDDVGIIAFYGSALTSVDLSGTQVKAIKERTFVDCHSLKEVILPEGLTTVEKRAFYRSGSLSAVTLPASLQTIGEEAFYYCGGLSSVTFLGDAPELGARAFADTASSLAIFVPKGATDYTGGNWASYSWRVVSGAALSELTVSAGDLAPAFFPGTNGYSLSVANSVEDVTLTPTAHGSGTVTVNDAAVASGDASGPIPLEAGKTTEIDIVVQNSPDDTRTYTVAVTRAAAVIDISAVSGVTAPVRGAVPVTEAAETEQYTGAVAWTPDPGGAFAADTAYTATITLTPKPGYTLEGVGENSFAVEGAATVTNAAGSGVITAVFPKTDPAPSSGGSSYSYYAVTPTAGEGGAIDPAEPVRVRQGKDQTFTITPAEGYAVADVLVDGESVGAVETYTFKKVKARHTIEAVFAPAWVNPFTDVAEDDWFYGPVAWAQGAGIMTGTAADTFEPEAPVTRAALVTTLYRLAGKPQGGGEGSPFTDIPSGQWYSGAAAWAVDAGVTQGVGGGRFDPDGAVTREQLFTLLYRFALYQKRDVSMGEDTNILSYTDAMELAEWAVPAFQWACGAGLTEGTQDGRLAPEEVATRAQLAAVLERYAGA